MLYFRDLVPKDPPEWPIGARIEEIGEYVTMMFQNNEKISFNALALFCLWINNKGPACSGSGAEPRRAPDLLLTSPLLPGSLPSDRTCELFYYDCLWGELDDTPGANTGKSISTLRVFSPCGLAGHRE